MNLMINELYIIDDFSAIELCPNCEESHWCDSQDDWHKWNMLFKETRNHCGACGVNILRWQRDKLIKLIEHNIGKFEVLK